MGNVGSIEKVMVFGILGIIVAILGIAMWGSNEIESPEIVGVTAYEIGGNVESLKAEAAEPGAIPLGAAESPLVRPASIDNGLPAAADAPRVEVDLTAKAEEIPDEPLRVPVAASPALDAPAAAGVVAQEYVVQKGDTLEAIALRTYGDRSMVSEILKINEDLDPTRMRIGLRIQLPAAGGGIAPIPQGVPPVQPTQAPAPALVKDEPGPAALSADGSKRYTVGKNDTLYGIARKVYGDTKRWRDIADANKAEIPDVSKLRPGMVIKLP